MGEAGSPAGGPRSVDPHVLSGATVQRVESAAPQGQGAADELVGARVAGRGRLSPTLSRGRISEAWRGSGAGTSSRPATSGCPATRATLKPTSAPPGRAARARAWVQVLEA